MKEPDGRLENTQELRGAQRPAVAQEDVVLLLNADAGELAENVQLVGEILELNQFDLPVALLLRGNGLQGDSSVAVATPAIMKEDVDFLHRGHCCMVRGGSYKSTPHAMWKTQKPVCVQRVPRDLSRSIRAFFMHCSYPVSILETCDATCMCIQQVQGCATLPA